MDERRADMLAMKLEMKELRQKVDDNTELTQQIKKDTADLITFFRDVQGGFRIASAFGKFAKWVMIVSAAATAAYAWFYAVTHGMPPPKL